MPEYHGWEPFETQIILDCVELSEYTALSEAKKDLFRIIISAGRINFRENSPAWNAIMNSLFPIGTGTHAALLTRVTRSYDNAP